jgi:hypothetical protein
MTEWAVGPYQKIRGLTQLARPKLSSFGLASYSSIHEINRMKLYPSLVLRRRWAESVDLMQQMVLSLNYETKEGNPSASRGEGRGEPEGRRGKGCS